MNRIQIATIKKILKIKLTLIKNNKINKNLKKLLLIKMKGFQFTKTI